MAPSYTKQWTVENTTGFDGLQWNEKAEIPQLGEHDVLVHFLYASLNYRDLIVSKGKYVAPITEHVVPGSDGAGVVEAVGSRVTRFKPGDKVVSLFTQGYLAGSMDDKLKKTALGGGVNGTLRQYGAFDEQNVVAMPSTLNFQEASTLTCAGVTAWNALYGLEGRTLKPGDTVLTQGTGGVSIFALQFAKAAGAQVIATTSSSEKGEFLRKLGADHVINYKTDPNWGESVKALTPDRAGAHHIVEVGGPTTLAQSLKSIRPDGVITIIGFLGGYSKDQPSFVEALLNVCIVRGILVGSRQQFEAMNRAIDAIGLKPVVDPKTFALEDLKDAYQYMWEQKHFGKLTIKIDSTDQSKL